MVTLGIRIMANLPDRTDDQRRVDHRGQSGHFYLAESGHFYLGNTVTSSGEDSAAEPLRHQSHGHEQAWNMAGKDEARYPMRRFKPDAVRRV